MSSRLSRGAFLAVLVVALAGSAQAGPVVVTLSASSWGTCTQSSGTCAAGASSLAGYQSNGSSVTDTFRNYIWFNITPGALSGPVLSAVLRLGAGDVVGSFPLYQLRNSTATSPTYTSVVGGTTYGSFEFMNPGDDYQTKDLTLNSSARTALDAIGLAGGTFRVAGYVSNVMSSETREVFAGTSPGDTRQLLLTVNAPDVPEPTTLALLGLGLVACALRMRRTRG